MSFTSPESNKSRIINIHPSYLPQFPGKQGYLDAFNQSLTESGITIHHVDSGIDTGPIILQEKFPRLKDDDFEALESRGMELEYKLYPIVLEKVLNNELKE